MDFQMGIFLLTHVSKTMLTSVNMSFLKLILTDFQMGLNCKPVTMLEMQITTKKTILVAALKYI